MSRSKPDPTPYCRNHLQEFLPCVEPSRVHIRFHPTRTRLFRSACRPCGHILLNYPAGSDSIAQKRVWAKMQEHPERAFREMRHVYRALSKANLQRQMPFPYSVDPAGGVVFTGFVAGSSLIGTTLRHLLLPVHSPPDWLLDIYQRIGQWLSGYHMTMANGKTVRLGDLISRAEAALASDHYFSPAQKTVLTGYLEAMRENPGSDYPMRLTRPHNDFCLRNILLKNHSEFSVIDWDAMVENDFPQEASFWNDLTTFSTNTQSLIRFHPFVSLRHIRALVDSFLTGYLAHGTLDPVADPKLLLWFFTLCYFLGMIGDRPLHQIYQKQLTARYIAALVKTLLQGEHNVAATPRVRS